MRKGTVPASMRNECRDLLIDASIELDGSTVRDRNVEEIASRLKRNQCVQSLSMKDSLFTCEGFRSPTLKRLRCLLECIPHMKQLQEVELSGEMSIDNPHDVQILSNAIRRHPTLRRITFHNFVVYSAELEDSAPLLDTFLESCSTLPHLETLHLKCHASHKTWHQSYISVRALEPLCCSPLLQKLTLSKLGLQDEHFDCIGQLMHRSMDSRLLELNLNGNRNSDIGMQSIAKHLLTPRFETLERLEFSNGLLANDATSNLLLRLLNANHHLQHLKVNLRQHYRKEVEFYLLLNRSGRKVIMNPDTAPEEAINVLGAARANISVLMHLLRDNPALCKPREASACFDVTVAAGASASTGWEKESATCVCQNEDQQLLDNDVGTISVAPSAIRAVKNLAVDLWRRLRNKKK
jgi:hypothetical protein